MYEIIIIILAIFGFGVSYFIYDRKRKNKHMVCMIGNDCDIVIHSKYNNLFGIPLENLGLLYYFGVIVLVVLMLNGVVDFSGISVLSVLIFLGIGSVIFSFYLTYVQIAILKEYCEYCLSSALASTLIFLFEII